MKIESGLIVYIRPIDKLCKLLYISSTSTLAFTDVIQSIKTLKGIRRLET